MDRAGIDRRVIAILDWGLALGESSKTIVQIHKEILGICANTSDRLIGFAGLDPRRHDALAILLWAFDELGAKGLKLHPTSQWCLEDKRTHQLVSAAASRGLPVLVHVGRTMPILTDRFSQPEAIVKLAQAFPETPIIAGHSGFEQWEVFANDTAVPSNLYCDISGWQEMIGDDWPQLRLSLRRLCSAMPDRVCFGSDSPFFTNNLAVTEKRWIRAVRENAPIEYADTILANPLFGSK
jgi:predicted TIM-barrel fold metal-dependent hydrolase